MHRSPANGWAWHWLGSLSYMSTGCGWANLQRIALVRNPPAWEPSFTLVASVVVMHRFPPEPEAGPVLAPSKGCLSSILADICQTLLFRTGFQGPAEAKKIQLVLWTTTAIVARGAIMELAATRHLTGDLLLLRNIAGLAVIGNIELRFLTAPLPHDLLCIALPPEAG